MTAYYPNQPGPVLLTQMLNDLLATTFVPDDIVYETPSVIDIDGRNTALSFQVIRGPLRGRRSVCHYKRLDLQTLIGSRSVQIEDTGSITSVADLLPIIQSTYNIALTAVDIDDTAITIGEYPVTVTLTAKTDSYIVYGSTTVQIVASSGGGTSGDLVTTYNATLADPFVDINGDLLILDAYDSPHSPNSFLQQTEGTFLAAVRTYSDWDWVGKSQHGAVYNLSGVQDGQGEWYITWVAGLMDPGNFANDYDVQIRVEVTDQPAVPVVNLTLTDTGSGTWALVDSNTNLSIDVIGLSGTQAFGSDFAASKLIGATPEDTSGLNGVTKTTDGVPVGEFKINLILTRKSDSVIVSNCEITGTHSAWIDYPLSSANVMLGSMFLDVNGFLLGASSSPDGNFYRSETENITIGGRALPRASEPVAAVMAPAIIAGDLPDLYKFRYDPSNPEKWYIQLAVKLDDVALIALDTAGPAALTISMESWDGGANTSLQLEYSGKYTPGSGFTFVEGFKANGVPNLTPSYISPDNKLIEFNIPITSIAGYFDPAFLDANNLPEKMMVTCAIDTGKGESSLIRPKVNILVQARSNLPDIYMTGLNGIVYAYAPSTLPTVDHETFLSADELGGSGYEQWPYGIYRIVDGVLIMTIEGLSGYLSNYTGSINNIVIYGCDPVTGDIVETYPLDPVAWNFNVTQYPLPDMPVLNGSLKWRAAIEPYLTHTPTQEVVFKTIDVPVLVSDPVAKILSLDGVPIDEPQASLAVSFDPPVYDSTRLLDITSVVYAMPAGVVELTADGPHTAEVLINGQQLTIDFVSESY